MNKYEKRTIGFYLNLSKALFGATSPAVKWLEDLAIKHNKDMNTVIIKDERQVMALLTTLAKGKS